MNARERDADLLIEIARYAAEIEGHRLRFGDSLEAFCRDTAYQQCCSHCIVQIGELARALSDGFRQEHDEIDWRGAVDMRNLLVHDYAKFKPDIVWQTMVTDIPALRSSCECALADMGIDLAAELAADSAPVALDPPRS